MAAPIELMRPYEVRAILISAIKPDYNSLEKIKEEKRKQKLSVRTLSELAEIQELDLTAILKGKRTPNRNQFFSLTTALGKNADNFFPFKENYSEKEYEQIAKTLYGQDYNRCPSSTASVRMLTMSYFFDKSRAA